jgi:hypothetical protein
VRRPPVFAIWLLTSDLCHLIYSNTADAASSRVVMPFTAFSAAFSFKEVKFPDFKAV